MYAHTYTKDRHKTCIYDLFLVIVHYISYMIQYIEVHTIYILFLSTYIHTYKHTCIHANKQNIYKIFTIPRLTTYY